MSPSNGSVATPTASAPSWNDILPQEGESTPTVNPYQAEDVSPGKVGQDASPHGITVSSDSWTTTVSRLPLSPPLGVRIRLPRIRLQPSQAFTCLLSVTCLLPSSEETHWTLSFAELPHIPTTPTGYGPFPTPPSLIRFVPTSPFRPYPKESSILPRGLLSVKRDYPPSSNE